jgi:hypothetical protein
MQVSAPEDSDEGRQRANQTSSAHREALNPPEKTNTGDIAVQDETGEASDALMRALNGIVHDNDESNGGDGGLQDQSDATAELLRALSSVAPGDGNVGQDGHADQSAGRDALMQALSSIVSESQGDEGAANNHQGVVGHDLSKVCHDRMARLSFVLRCSSRVCTYKHTHARMHIEQAQELEAQLASLLQVQMANPEKKPWTSSTHVSRAGSSASATSRRPAAQQDAERRSTSTDIPREELARGDAGHWKQSHGQEGAEDDMPREDQQKVGTARGETGQRTDSAGASDERCSDGMSEQTQAQAVCGPSDPENMGDASAVGDSDSQGHDGHDFRSHGSEGTPQRAPLASTDAGNKLMLARAALAAQEAIRRPSLEAAEKTLAGTERTAPGKREVLAATWDLGPRANSRGSVGTGGRRGSVPSVTGDGVASKRSSFDLSGRGNRQDLAGHFGRVSKNSSFDFGGVGSDVGGSRPPLVAAQVSARSYVCVCIYLYTCIYVYVCMYVCMHVCMYVCMYSHTHTHTYTHAHAHIDDARVPANHNKSYLHIQT